MATHTVDGMNDEEKIRHKLSLIYKKCERDEECLIVKEGSTTRLGYMRHHLRYPGHRDVNTTLHRAVYILENRQPRLIGDKDAGDVSHRCGRKECVEITHLVLESRAENTARRKCHRSKSCNGCSPSCVILR